MLVKLRGELLQIADCRLPITDCGFAAPLAERLCLSDVPLTKLAATPPRHSLKF
jgi:hypothetical protein